MVAGGRSTRAWPYLRSAQPKSLADIDGRPFLEIQLARLAELGATRVHLCLGVGAEMIIDAVATMGTRAGRYAAMPIVTYTVEDRPLGVVGAVRHAMAHDHLTRLWRSARMLRIPVTEAMIDSLRVGTVALARALGGRAHLYLRPTVYIDSGRYGFRPETTRVGSFVAGFPVDRPEPGTGLRCLVSSWRRESDLTMPPRIKSGGAYNSFRLPLIEASQRGFDDAILLDEHGLVSEATGAAVFLVRDRRLITPDLASGVLESITRRKVMELAPELGYEGHERRVSRSELYVADEVFLAGTLCEVQAVTDVDGLLIGSGRPGPATMRLAAVYLSICEGNSADRRDWFTPCQ